MIKLLGKFCGDERNNDSELSNWFYFLTLFRKLKCGKVHRIFFFWDEQNIANFKTDFKRVCLNKLRCLKGELWQYHICLSLWYLETHDQAWIWYVRVSLRVFSLIWSSLDQGRLSSLQLCTLCLLISHVCIASWSLLMSKHEHALKIVDSFYHTADKNSRNHEIFLRWHKKRKGSLSDPASFGTFTRIS